METELQDTPSSELICKSSDSDMAYFIGIMMLSSFVTLALFVMGLIDHRGAGELFAILTPGVLIFIGCYIYMTKTLPSVFKLDNQSKTFTITIGSSWQKKQTNGTLNDIFAVSLYALKAGHYQETRYQVCIFLRKQKTLILVEIYTERSDAVIRANAISTDFGIPFTMNPSWYGSSWDSGTPYSDNIDGSKLGNPSL